MKANELMIGNWVSNLNVKGRYMKVTNIYGSGRCTLDEELSALSKDLAPIPLTEEILAKNFEKYSDPAYGESYDYSTDFQDVSIKLYTDGLWKVVVDEVEMSGLPTWKMYVCNVHQLQNALRLAGVNIDIVL